MAKKILRAVLILVLISLLSAAGTVYSLTMKKAAWVPGFHPMPMDTAGGNMIGNLPENLEAGGFMAGQSGLVYFANPADGGALYMCRENGEDMVKITDFPVCNINVLGTSLVFTGFERYVDGLGNFIDFEPDFNDKEYFLSYLMKMHLHSGDSYLPGGRLYVIYNVNGDNPDFHVINPGVTYYSPFLDRDGLYVTYKAGGQTVLANKFYDAKSVMLPYGENMGKRFSSGDKIYAELRGASENERRIVRFDKKTLMPLDYINGKDLYCIGRDFVFHTEDGCAYEITAPDGSIKPISSVALRNLKANQFGEISADTDSGHVVLSKEKWYGVIGQLLAPRLKDKPITRQNGWYNYFNSYSRHLNSPIYFKAADNYFYIDDSGWSEPWLNVRVDSAPLVSLSDMAVEAAFAPPWVDYSEDAEPVNPASDEDFGSERTARPDGRASAADNAASALDAAILILTGDESIADKYTGESVERLRIRYGGVFEAAVIEVAEELSHAVHTRLDVSVSADEIHDVIINLLQNASYGVGAANIAQNGMEASVAISAANTLDLEMLNTEYQNALLSLSGKEHDAQAAADGYAGKPSGLLLEIMRNPSRYNVTDSRISDSQIHMTYSDCWTADSPAALVRSLIFGAK